MHGRSAQSAGRTTGISVQQSLSPGPGRSASAQGGFAELAAGMFARRALAIFDARGGAKHPWEMAVKRQNPGLNCCYIGRMI
jgi:hypothetical protein